MKISIFRIQLFSDTVTFRSYGLCQRAGGVGVDPQTNFVEKAGEGVEKTVGGFNPPTPSTTKSLAVSYLGLLIRLGSVCICSAGLQSEVCFRPPACLPARRLPASLPLHCRDPVPTSTCTRSALQLRPLIAEINTFTNTY